LGQSAEVYLNARREAEASGLPLNRIIAAVSPSLERSLRISAQLRAAGRLRLAQAQQRARALLFWQRSLSLVAVAFVVVALAVVGKGVQTLIFAPIGSLREAMRRFREGDDEARAPSSPTAETQELASTF